MLVNPLISSILRDAWMIDPAAAESYMPIVVSLLNREVTASAGKDEPKEKATTLPFAIGIVGGAVASSRYGTYDEAPEGSVAVITVDGPMMTEDYCGYPGTRTLGARIKEADAHENVAAIVIRFNTPGGTVSGTEAFANTIKSTLKPTVAFADQMCSAGYWAGSGADLIVVSGMTAAIGSIGTMATINDFTGYYEKNGIKIHSIRATESKDKNEAYLQAQQGKYDAYRKEQLDPLNAVFLGAVDENRAGKLSSKENVKTGKVYFGETTVKHGLADEKGDFDYAIMRALELANQETETDNSNTNSTQMFGKNKYKAVAALAGKKGDEITQEMVDAANAELEADGITGVALITEAQHDAFEAAVASEKTLQTQVQTLTEANTKLTGERDAAQAKADEYGEKAGEKPTSAKKTGVDTPTGEPDANQKAIDELPHNQALAGNPLFN
jgi:ClpP class serine protease